VTASKYGVYQWVAMQSMWEEEEINILANIADWLALPNVTNDLFRNENHGHRSLYEAVSWLILERPGKTAPGLFLLPDAS